MDNPIAKRKDAGLLAAEVLKRFSGLAIEDEGRLTNFRIREHFLTKIFLFAKFRKVKKSHSVSTLVKFHTHNKFLYMCYFKGELEAKEKSYFLRMLEKYKNETVPLSAVLSVLQSWIIKHDKTYLHEQTYFEPFPEGLVEITDSGKGRKV